MSDKFEVTGIYNCIKKLDFANSEQQKYYESREHLEKQKIPPKPEATIRFVCISDTHCHQNSIDLPQGDVLLHTGDFTYRGLVSEINTFSEWLSKQKHPYKIVIAGNHELTLDKPFYEKNGSLWHHNNFQDVNAARAALLKSGCIFLEDQEVTINGVRIYGSPWQPEFNNMAFNVERGPDIMEKWKKIPRDGIHILMTHGPSKNYGDRVYDGERVGCYDLGEVIKELQPLVHIFGHIHEDYGVFKDSNTTHINASNCGHNYQALNTAIVFDLKCKAK